MSSNVYLAEINRLTTSTKQNKEDFLRCLPNIKFLSFLGPNSQIAAKFQLV